jgi:ABC-type spermidine/putrescine transport system permease subunit I
MMSLFSNGEVRGAGLLARTPAWVWLLGPYLLLLVGTLLLPLTNLAVISVFRHNPSTMWVAEPTVANYTRLLDAYYMQVLVRTLRIGLITTIFCLLLGAPLAYWLARCSRRTLAIGLFFIFMPMMVSTVIRAFGWMILLGRNGIINQASVEIGIGRWLFVMNTETAVIIALIQICLPLMVLPAMAAIEKVPMSLEEAATNLGAGPLALFRKVVLPLALPGLASGALLAFVVAISVVVTPALMGGRSNRMIGNEIYDQVLTALNWPFASAMAIMLIVFVVLLLGVSLWIAGRIGSWLIGPPAAARA